MKKLLPVLGSRNFIVSILAIFLLALEANGINIPVDGAEELYDKIANYWAELSVFIVMPIVKTIERFNNKQWLWEWIKSPNFATQVGSVILIIAGVFFGQELAAVITAIVINLFNVFWHSRQTIKNSKV